MHRLANILAILILLLTAAPIMACMTDYVMNPEESACCRAMHGKCEGMEKMGAAGQRFGATSILNLQLPL